MKFVYSTTIDIKAVPEPIWRTLATVMEWPEWLPTIASIDGLDGESLQLGSRFRICQPRLRPAIWEVIELQPGRSFTWQSRSAGLCAIASHAVNSISASTTQVTLSVEFTGWLAFVARIVAGKLTQDYIDREAHLLKARVESGGSDRALPNSASHEY